MTDEFTDSPQHREWSHRCPPWVVEDCDGGDACWDECFAFGTWSQVEVGRG